jgi:hypothetical protein
LLQGPAKLERPLLTRQTEKEPEQSGSFLIPRDRAAGLGPLR